MSGRPLDEIDYAVLYALQEDARHNTNAAISERVSVSASTVGKRISRMEAEGMIRGYRSSVDYEKVGFPLQVLFICTAGIAERGSLTQEALGLDGVVNVRELIRGENNVHIQAVGASNEDITHVAHELDIMGYTVTDGILMRNEYDRPSVRFGTDTPSG
ncbi:Lrp/AsnC family transcriptional regulator [Natronomonas sp.]|uniref:Lrp/AsnC family transcriptional regulator n=1 Tax=Natronomonas sp. TaxID=2184060 RepID=UPI0039767613